MLPAIILLGVASGATAQVRAGDDAYIGVQYAHYTLGDGNGFEGNPTGLVGKAGVRLNNYFSVEARLGMGLGDDQSDHVTAEVERVAGAYLRGGLPLASWLEMYGMLGLSEVKVAASQPGFGPPDVGETEGTEGGFSYGGGLMWHATDHFSVVGEYMEYVDRSSVSVSAAELGLLARF